MRGEFPQGRNLPSSAYLELLDIIIVVVVLFLIIIFVLVFILFFFLIVVFVVLELVVIVRVFVFLVFVLIFIFVVFVIKLVFVVVQRFFGETERLEGSELRKAASGRVVKGGDEIQTGGEEGCVEVEG